MSKPDERHRVTATLDGDDFERLKYWARRRNMSINDYLKLAITRSIAYENRDYDLPTAEVARLNQLRDMVTSMNAEISVLEDIVVNGFESLIGLAKGDNNYLRDEDV